MSIGAILFKTMLGEGTFGKAPVQEENREGVYEEALHELLYSKLLVDTMRKMWKAEVWENMSMGWRERVVGNEAMMRKGEKEREGERISF